MPDTKDTEIVDPKDINRKTAKIIAEEGIVVIPDTMPSDKISTEHNYEER